MKRFFAHNFYDNDTLLSKKVITFLQETFLRRHLC